MDNKIVGIMVSIAVGLIMIGGVLSPIITSARGDFGTPIQYENAIDVNAPQHYDKLDEYVVTLTATADSYTVVANGVNMTKTAGGQPVIYSDAMTLTLSNTNSARVGSLILFDEEETTIPVDVGVSKTVEVSFDNGDYEIEIDGVSTYSGTYSWVFGVKPDGEYVTNTGTRNEYVNNVYSDIVYSGVYETGELDSGYYSYYNGEFTFTRGYDGELIFNSALVEGTTDIYYITGRSVSVTDGEITENFSPYRCLVKEVVKGHESGGAAYDLIGVIPIIVIVVLVFMAVGMIFRSRY